VIVASAAHRACEELDVKRLADGGRPEGASKTANVLHARELARRLKEEGAPVTANALCPGLVDTDLGRYLVEGAAWWQKPLVALLVPLTKQRAKTVPDGASTALYLSLDPALAAESGGYFVDSAPAISTDIASDLQLAKELWDATDELVAQRMQA